MSRYPMLLGVFLVEAIFMETGCCSFLGRSTVVTEDSYSCN